MDKRKFLFKKVRTFSLSLFRATKAAIEVWSHTMSAWLLSNSPQIPYMSCS